MATRTLISPAAIKEATAAARYAILDLLALYPHGPTEGVEPARWLLAYALGALAPDAEVETEIRTAVMRAYGRSIQ